MPSVARTLAVDLPLYSMAELIELRRNILRYARSLPPGPARNQRLQIALSLRALFKNEKWLESHTLKRSDPSRLGNECGGRFRGLVPLNLAQGVQF
jgi:hypothetical protein